jgi:hypothetical protein
MLPIGVHVNPYVVYDGNNVKFWMIPHILWNPIAGEKALDL